jgi:hypothetical protein
LLADFRGSFPPASEREVRLSVSQEWLCLPGKIEEKQSKLLVNAAEDGNAGVAEDVCDLGLAEAGGVVFEREVELGVVETEAAEAVGVGEFAEGAELVVREWRLEFEFGFEKCH